MAIKSYLKKNKDTEIISSNIYLSGTRKKINSIYQSQIERTENTVTFRAYLERTFDLTTKTGQKALDKVLEEQKSPLPNLITSIEKEHNKYCEEVKQNGGTPEKLYRLTDI